MEAQHVPGTPEWRPRSSHSEGVPSAATSSLLRHQQLSSHGDRSSLSSAVYSATTSVGHVESISAGRDIAPFEAAACERLIESIRSFSLSDHVVTDEDGTKAQMESLANVLGSAARTIRYNAKWFAPHQLCDLLNTALDAASTSSMSADLTAGLSLINAVGTYSSVPLSSVPRVTKFLARTYYSATRANKTRKLAETAWDTTQRIMATHVGIQLIDALLQIIREIDESLLQSRVGYARIAGSLMIISDKLLPRKSTDRDMPTPGMTELLMVLSTAVVRGDEYVRDLVMDLVSNLLAEKRTVDILTIQSAWKSLLTIVKACVNLEAPSPKARTLVDGLISHLGNFDHTDYKILASLCIEVERPLDPVLKDAIFNEWTGLTPATDWKDNFDPLLKHFSASIEFAGELQVFLERATAIATHFPENFSLLQYAQTLESCITLDITSLGAVAMLGPELVAVFKHAIVSCDVGSNPNEIFWSLCRSAHKSVDITTFLMTIRADVEGAGYIDTHGTIHFINNDLLDRLHITLLKILEHCEDWNIYHIILREMPFLIGNHAMFDHHHDFITRLRDGVCALLDGGGYREPPTHTGLTKSHVAAHLVEVLTALLSYSHLYHKADLLSSFSTILKTARSRDYVVSIPCIHAITMMCYEYPDLTGRFMDDIIDQMARMVTQRYLAIHVLLFLAGLSRLPDLFQNSFQTQDYKKIFGVCGSYLQSIRGSSLLLERNPTPSDDWSSKTSSVDTTDALPQYVYALAHHVIAFWYIAISKEQRKAQRDYITSCLKYSTAEDEEIIEDQGLVTIDLMDRIDSDTAYFEDEDDADFEFDDSAGRITLLHRLRGLFLITTETALRTAETIVTVRRSTGTSKRIIDRSRGRRDTVVTSDENDDDMIPVFPDDVTGRTYGRIIVPAAPTFLGSAWLINLPNDDDAFIRAIQSIDRTPGLDSHKAGVIYIGEGQKTEEEILQNVQGSPDYIKFVEGLGTLRRVKNAQFNTQGLDRTSDADGAHAVVWNNEVTELVFHITTLMPNNADVNLNTANKKRHIGNDFVNIIFNNSGTPFDFNTFPSQFNAVYIVIAPSARTSFLQTRTHRSDGKTNFYRVQVLTRPGYPAISSAATEKIVSAESLAGYVRNLALNDCVFSVMWSSHEMEAGEYPSSWRSRLEQIRRLRRRFG